MIEPNYMYSVMNMIHYDDVTERLCLLSNMGVYGAKSLKPTRIFGTSSGPQAPCGVPIMTCPVQVRRIYVLDVNLQQPSTLGLSMQRIFCIGLGC